MSRKAIPALVFALAFSGSCVALQAVTYTQPPHWSAEKKAARLTSRQSRILHLTPDQYQRILTANQLYGNQIDNLEAATRQGRTSQMEKLKTILSQRDASYRQILNADQYKHWNDMEIRQKEKLKAYRSRRRDRILAEHPDSPTGNPDGNHPAP